MCDEARGQGGQVGLQGWSELTHNCIQDHSAIQKVPQQMGQHLNLSPKKVTSRKKSCFLQQGVKAMLIKHCACLSALAQRASLIQRLQR